ncbi:hypothetical protein BpHYR1_014664 [Brachionus plicatilis]|uniref:Uncharacterized protein n=1 Tax=Brachionus plicatilis TaxID=10195 RepID=A0A3M7RHV8_BRAPC|nr:hypothetical protein BpHYR1_014664 [Brachionus plicatilis]
MNIHTDFNILGKVDPTKTTVTPHEFIFRLKEANAISSIDYEKFKAILNKDVITVPNKDWIEKEKEKQFQNLFRQFWPNVYSTINPPEPKSVPTLISELEKKRAICELIAKQDLERHKASLAHNELLTNYSNVYTSKMNDTLNICINGLSSGSPKIEINSNKPAFEAAKSEPEKKYPNLASSYDFNFKSTKYLDTIVNSPYNPNDLTKETELLKSIQESQEKLKLTQKLEKTTDLVDDIIEKVKVLQLEMKKKSASYKLMNDIEQLKKEHEENERKNELMALLDKELERKKYCHLNHHHHHQTNKNYLDSDSSSENEKRSKSPALSDHRPRMSVTFSKHNREPSRSRRKSPQRLRKSNSYIGPKVDCWNCNCSHDRNVY